jgi:hypothetical protein
VVTIFKTLMLILWYNFFFFFLLVLFLLHPSYQWSLFSPNLYGWNDSSSLAQSRCLMHGQLVALLVERQNIFSHTLILFRAWAFCGCLIWTRTHSFEPKLTAIDFFYIKPTKLPIFSSLIPFSMAYHALSTETHPRTPTITD